MEGKVASQVSFVELWVIFTIESFVFVVTHLHV